MQIFWLKRNLRLQDSEPLFESMRAVRSSGAVLPLYCHEPSLIDQPDVARQHQLFIQETLEELGRDIQSIGGKLLQAVGETVDVLDRIHRARPITKIWTHRETTQACQYERDRGVIAWCVNNDVKLMEIEQNGIARAPQTPESFPDYFGRSVRASLRDPMGKDLSDRFANLPFPCCDPTDIPQAAGEDKSLRQQGGRSSAIANLQRFFNIESLRQYPYQISSPNTAWEGCSRISTYLAYGVLSDREVLHAVDRVVTEAHGKMTDNEFRKFQENARFYLDRLSWRRQYIQTFESNPRLEFECMLPQFNGVREAEFNEAYFEAWKQGRTGFPYIDAAMRCLNATGWINMRLRATVVSFATMNLWIPTIRVAEYLATEFLDYEPGVHHVIHQLIAGTTTFSGLMVYDPVKQGKDHDIDGKFIKKWIPELSDVGKGDIHNLVQTKFNLSHEAQLSGLTPYPEAIIDHKVTGQRAKDRINRLQKGQTDVVPEVPSAVQRSLF